MMPTTDPAPDVALPAPDVALIDTHTHLHLAQFDDDRAATLARATAAGVQRMIEIGYDLPSSRAALELASSHPHIYAVVGIQPNHIVALPPDWREQLTALLRHPKVVALGEIGLDYYWMKAAPEQQAHYFREQLDLARQHHLPVVIHTREAAPATVQVLREAAAGVRGVMHSFSGDWEFAQACLDLGFYLSFSGPVTFRKARDLHDVARRTPIERILTETDSPYLSPSPWRGKRNEPAYVRLVAERLATLREQPLAQLGQHIWDNANTLFAFKHA